MWHSVQRCKGFTSLGLCLTKESWSMLVFRIFFLLFYFPQLYYISTATLGWARLPSWISLRPQQCVWRQRAKWSTVWSELTGKFVLQNSCKSLLLSCCFTNLSSSDKLLRLLFKNSDVRQDVTGEVAQGTTSSSKSQAKKLTWSQVNVNPR